MLKIKKLPEVDVRRAREERNARALELATLQAFAAIATPEMRQLRDALIPAVLAWEAGTTAEALRKWGPTTLGKRVLAALRKEPGLTPSEVAERVGDSRNKVSSSLIQTQLRKGRVRRELSGKKDRSGLPIWRYFALDLEKKV